MQAALTAALPVAIDAANSALASTSNTVAQAGNTNVNNAVGAGTPAVGGIGGNLNANLASLAGSTQFPLAATTQFSRTASTLGTINAQPMNATVSWAAVGEPAVSHTVQDMGNLLKAITDRRATLQTNRNTLKTALAGMTSVQAIAQQDVTAGW
jgi:hypothetical protein